MSEARTQALRQWLMTTTGLDDAQVILVDQSAPRPQRRPYVSLDPEMSLVTRHIEDQELPHPTTAGLLVRTAHKRLTVRVQVYGEGAAELLSQIQDGTERYDVRDALAIVGLVPIDKGTRTNLTALQDARYEPRWSADIQFSLVTQATEDVGWIAEVAGNGRFDGGPPRPYVIPS